MIKLIEKCLSTCKKYNIKEVLCTAWMDNGAETPVDAVWPGVALFAHLGFHLEYNEKVLEEEFKECMGGNLKDFMALDAFDSLFLNGKANQEAQFQQFASLEIHNCNLWHLGKELYYYPVYLLDLFFCYFTEKYLFILA